jgi:hypothetical protein
LPPYCPLKLTVMQTATCIIIPKSSNVFKECVLGWNYHAFFYPPPYSKTLCLLNILRFFFFWWAQKPIICGISTLQDFLCPQFVTACSCYAATQVQNLRTGSYGQLYWRINIRKFDTYFRRFVKTHWTQYGHNWRRPSASTTGKQNRRGRMFIPRAGFEITSPVFEHYAPETTQLLS